MDVQGNGSASTAASKPPYHSSFTQVTDFIKFARELGVVAKYDSSIMDRHKPSGGSRTALMTALRFLDLLDGEDPTGRLKALLTADDAGQKEIILQSLKDSYNLVDFDSLATATPGMLRGALEKYGLSGDTLRKALAFLVAALRFTGHPLSPTLQDKGRARARTQAGKKRTRTTPKLGEGDSPPPGGGSGNSQMHTVDFGAVQINVSITGQLFGLNGDQMSSVTNLFDAVKRCEDAAKGGRD